jgi:hypothetical protein
MCGCFMSGNRESLASAGGKFHCEPGWRRPEAVFQHVRCGAVGQAHSTWEAVEQRPCNLAESGSGAGGEGGGKGSD